MQHRISVTALLSLLVAWCVNGQAVQSFTQQNGIDGEASQEIGLPPANAALADGRDNNQIGRFVSSRRSFRSRGSTSSGCDPGTEAINRVDVDPGRSPDRNPTDYRRSKPAPVDSMGDPSDGVQGGFENNRRPLLPEPEGIGYPLRNNPNAQAVERGRAKQISQAKLPINLQGVPAEEDLESPDRKFNGIKQQPVPSPVLSGGEQGSSGLQDSLQVRNKQLGQPGGANGINLPSPPSDNLPADPQTNLKQNPQGRPLLTSQDLPARQPNRSNQNGKGQCIQSKGRSRRGLASPNRGKVVPKWGPDEDLVNRYLEARDGFTLALLNAAYNEKVLNTRGQGSNPGARGNLIFSPFSIWQALVLTYVISKGDLKAEMEENLGLENLGTTPKLNAFLILKSMENIRSQFLLNPTMNTPGGDGSFRGVQPLPQQIQTPGTTPSNTPLQGTPDNTSSPILEVANRIYYTDILKIKKRTKEVLTEELRPANFIENSSEELEAINGWIGNVTRGKIKDMLTSSDINSRTALMLINAAYFKGRWALPFPKGDTKEEEFYLDPAKGQKILVPTMKLKDVRLKIEKIERLGAQVVELPYWTPGGDMVEEDYGSYERYVSGLNMHLIIPDKSQDGIDKLVKSVQAEDLHGSILTSSMGHQVDTFTLPRFKVETKWDLRKPLENLGLGSMFDKTRADFGCLTNDLGGTAVSSAKHEAVVEVTETGTEAAAVTSIGIELRGLDKRVKDFKVDRPFIYAITVSKPRTVLFLGVVRNPLNP